MSGRVNTSANQGIARLLENLVSANVDSQMNLQNAADLCDDADVRTLFQELAAERCQNALELKELASNYGADTSESGSWTGAWQQAWADIQAALGGGVTMLLNHVERGESRVRREYSDACQVTLPTRLRDLMAKHRAGLENAQNQLRSMQDAYQD